MKLIPKPRDAQQTPLALLNLMQEIEIYTELDKLNLFTLVPLKAVVNISPAMTSWGIYLPHEDIPNYICLWVNKFARPIAPAKQWFYDPLEWTDVIGVVTYGVDMSLFELIETLTYPDLLAILCQIIHTLCVFEPLEIAHHDLHSSNIRIKIHSQPVQLRFKTTTILTRYIVQIYDYNRSSIYKDSVLDKLDDIQIKQVCVDRDWPQNNTTKCITFNSKEDAFKILCTLLQPQYMPLLLELVPGLYYNTTTIGEIYETCVASLNLDNLDNLDYKRMVVPHQRAFEQSGVLDWTFEDYFKSVGKYHVIHLPSPFSSYTMFIPSAIMLSNEAILHTLLQKIQGIDKTS